MLKKYLMALSKKERQRFYMTVLIYGLALRLTALFYLPLSFLVFLIMVCHFTPNYRDYLKMKSAGVFDDEEEGPIITHVTPAGGNVFEDLGFSPEEAAALKKESDERLACKG